MDENNATTEKKERDPLPEYFDTIEEAAEFWDTHSLADYPEAMGEEVEFEFVPRQSQNHILIATDLLNKLKRAAAQQNVALETLVNLWLSERLMEASS